MAGPADAPLRAPDPGFAPCIVAWQRRHGRHGLPWQGSRDPYRVWLSEVMLQQTQVATVRRHYAGFLARFPDVERLAAAPLDAVLAAWSGLGYYRRARLLHACAQAVVERLGGRFPASAAGLAELPGIGRSTAAAVASFCTGERVSILDGNVRRVLARRFGLGERLEGGAGLRGLWALAEALTPADPADMPAYTQGLMDLGATVCTARRPRCEACPLAEACVARAAGQPEAYPQRAPARARGAREHWWLWLVDPEGAVWMLPRAAEGVWGGLWSLPLLKDPEQVEAAARRLGPGMPVEPQPTLRHALTHFDWTLHPRRLRLAGRPAPAELDQAGLLRGDAGPGAWHPPEAWPGLGLPAPLSQLLGRGGPRAA